MTSGQKIEYPPSKSGLFQLLEIEPTSDGNYKFVVKNAKDSDKEAFPVLYDHGQFNLRTGKRVLDSKEAQDELKEYLSEQLKKYFASCQVLFQSQNWQARA